MCKCANCGNETADIIPLDEVRGLSERLTPGDDVPAGECFKCGALCYALGTDNLEKILVVSTAHLGSDDCDKLQAYLADGYTSWIWDYPEGLMVNVPSDRADDKAYQDLKLSDLFWEVFNKAVALGCRKLQFDAAADVLPGCSVEEE
jgi:hypothetical protein